VVALPAVEPPQIPPLQPVNRNEILCAGKNPLVLPVEGAPVVFATAYLHDAALRLTRKDGSSVELPARADPTRGGFVVSAAEAGAASLHAHWGFDRYDGPGFKLADAHAQSFTLAPGDSPDLIAGRANTIHLRADSVSCLDDITLVDSSAKSHKVEWKKTHPNEVELTLPTQDVSAGELTLRVAQASRPDAQTLALHAFAQAGHLESFTLHAGDTEGILRGNRLDEVRRLVIAGVQFNPGTLSSRDGHDELAVLAQSGSDTHTLKSGEAQVTLEDGRIFNVKATVSSPRPSALLISKSLQWSGSSGENAIQLASESELPLEARLTFSIRAQSPTSFTADEKLEIAATDGSFSALLGVGTAQVMLQSKSVAVITLDPSKALGASAFGPLQFRRIVEGVGGEWVPLATLVRLPKFTGVDCGAEPNTPCSLTGLDLFLLDSVSVDADFSRVTHVPDGFTSSVLRIPHPQQGKLYLRLRDDPEIVNVARLAVKTPPAPASDASSPGPEHLQAQQEPSPQPAITASKGPKVQAR